MTDPTVVANVAVAVIAAMLIQAVTTYSVVKLLVMGRGMFQRRESEEPPQQSPARVLAMQERQP
jgi:hypothetical protein